MTDVAVRQPGIWRGTLTARRYIREPGLRAHVLIPPIQSLTADALSGRPSTWRIEPPLDGEPWMWELVGKINHLARLPLGWDSYEAVPLDRKAAIAAIELLDNLGFGGPAPAVAPTPDGDLHLEWTLPGLGVEITVDSGGGVQVVSEDDHGLLEWETGFSGDSRLIATLTRVSELALR